MFHCSVHIVQEYPLRLHILLAFILILFIIIIIHPVAVVLQ